jgi:hypothetical protein
MAQLLVLDVTNAKYLWKRIPASLRNEKAKV